MTKPINFLDSILNLPLFPDGPSDLANPMPVSRGVERRFGKQLQAHRAAYHFEKTMFLAATAAV